jgi:hypothetical protein
MKKLLLVVLPVLLVVLGFILIGGNTGAPLRLGVIGFTNVNGGSQSIQIRLTNDSAGHFIFGARVQSFSDSEMRELVSDTRYRSTGQVLAPQSITVHIFDTFQNNGVIRLRIPYRRVPANFQNFLNRCLERIGFGPVFKPSELMEIVSDPIPLPPRSDK